MARVRVSVCRLLIYIALALVVFELLILNVAILYAISIHHQFDDFLSSSDPFLEKLRRVPMFKKLLFRGKGGGFEDMFHNTVGRLFLVSERASNSVEKIQQSSQFDGSDISYLSYDVSSDGEALFLIRRIKQRGALFSKTYQLLVIDIGANDGIMYSNSFNLIQLGWDAILVEPQISLLRQAKDNLRRYADPYNERSKHKVILLNAVLGERDGSENVVLMEDDMETHIMNAKSVDLSGKLIVTVPSLTVKTFAHKYEVPTRFAVLSIDAEGVGDKVLHQWIDGGFEPAYIIYEALHNKESMVETSIYLQKRGYRFMTRLGWNYIFEHQPDSDSGE